MAKRRMLSVDVIKKDRFIKLSHEAQCLYMHLCLDADDDGFVGDVQTALRAYLCSEETLRALIENGYLLEFTPEVCAVRHWPLMNKIQRDRYTPTVYGPYLQKLRIDPYEGYVRLPEPGSDETPELPEDLPACLRLPELPLADGGSYTVSRAEFDAWIAAFPTVDVPQAIRSMRAWLLTNTDKQRSAGEMGRLIFRWLHNAQQKNAGAPKAPPGGAKREQPPPSYDIARAAERANTTVPKFKKRERRQT